MSVNKEYNVSTTCLESARQCMAPEHDRTRLEMAICGVCTAIISHRRPIIVAEVSHVDPYFTDLVGGEETRRINTRAHASKRAKYHQKRLVQRCDLNEC